MERDNNLIEQNNEDLLKTVSEVKKALAVEKNISLSFLIETLEKQLKQQIELTQVLSYAQFTSLPLNERERLKSLGFKGRTNKQVFYIPRK
ncbi:MAG TPA: hypothetical protein VD908_03535 [Cytophagales bacterium]|nr:hypothetical protein [Cytophagales bacterium]